MILRNIKLKNIRSYEHLNLDFPTGSTVLAGDIGSGKTSIFLAIEYALFGLQPGQKGSALLRNNADEGEVSLLLNLEGKEVLIERKLKRYDKSISTDYSAITVDNDKYESSITEVKTRILDLLGYPLEFIKKNNLLYKYTIYTPQEQMKQIVLEDSEIRLNTIRHIFGIEKYKLIRENLARFLNKLKDEIKTLQIEGKFLDEDIKKRESSLALVDFLSNNLFKLNEEYQAKKKKREEIEKEIRSIDDKIKENHLLEKELEKTNILIISKKEAFGLLQKQEKELLKLIEESERGPPINELKIETEFRDITTELEKLEIDYIDLSGSLSSLNKTKIDLERKKDRIFKIDICPTCLQNVSENHKHNIFNQTETEMNQLNKNILEVSINLNNLKNKIQERKLRKDFLDMERKNISFYKIKLEQVEKNKQRVSDLRKNKETLDKDISLLNTHLSQLKENIFKLSRYTNLHASKQKELSFAQSEEKKVEISLAEIKKERQMIEKDIQNLEISISEKKKISNKLTKYSEINDWLSTSFVSLIEFTERNILLKLRAEFSKLFNKWFNMLAGESFEARIDETFTPIIMQGDIEMDYSFLSGGERTAVALAYRLALNQTINSILTQLRTRGLLMLDEPTEGFSDLQLDKMREVLKELNAEQIIIVSHDQKIESFVDNLIKIEKTANASYSKEAP